ncbi:MAG TPA: OmpA family protein [Gemmatimonadaceae bacterium]|nr:OmpA family protein [Gemmatimonadaceae bacterium]
MASLVNSITELVTPDMASRVATTLGESDTAVTRGLRAGISSVLAGLVNRTGDSGAMSRVYEMATHRENDLDALGDVASNITRSMTGAVRTGGVADALLSTLFGGRSSEVGHLVARTAGFQKSSSGSMILSAAAPMVLGFLGRTVRDRSLGVSQFTSLIASQRDSILDAAPMGLGNLLDTESAARVGGPAYRREETHVPPPRTAQQREKSGGGWLWPLLGGAAVLALLWAVLGRDRTPQTTARAADTVAGTAAGAARRTVDTAAGTVAGVARDLGASTRHMLPGGVALDVPERGIESRLIGFIADERRPVNDTTWFNFDRLTFATGSATILPDSREQLDNIAAILKAYTNVRVRIGGYTDSSGDVTTNIRLSQQRAEAVRQALIGRGVAASRLTAEGYGAAHPVADNTTEAGRAQNRRIALRVMAK